jgi:hypothetical protein
VRSSPRAPDWAAVIALLFSAGVKLRLPASALRWRAPILLGAALVLDTQGIAAFAVAGTLFLCG